MLKAILQPVYFKSGIDEEYKKQLNILKDILSNFATILTPLLLGTNVNNENIDAVLFL